MTSFNTGKIALCVSVINLLCILFYLQQGQRHSDAPVRKVEEDISPYVRAQIAQGGHNHNNDDSLTAEMPDYGDHSPLGTLRSQGPVVLPSKKILRAMSEDSLFKTYHSYLDNVEILCRRRLRMGKLGDGGWEVCDDQLYRPRKHCIVYSVGIHYEFSFDDDIARLYGCQVYSFDPSMKNESYQRSPRVMFYKVGLAGKTYIHKKSKWSLKTLGDLKGMLNHKKEVIDVLKVDIENNEWGALPEMISSGQLRSVRQFYMEFHGLQVKYEQLALLKDIYDLGFRKFYVHKNPVCIRLDEKFPLVRTSCYETHYININRPQ